MTEFEPIVKVKIGDVYNLLLETSATVKKVEQQLISGDFENRIKELEEARWKMSGAAGILGGVISYLATKLRLK